MSDARTDALLDLSGYDARPAVSVEAASSTFAGAGNWSSGERRFALLALAGRGFRPPQFLRERHGNGAVDDLDDDVLRRAWDIEYRFLIETAPPAPEAYGVYVLGVNPPEGITGDQVVEFNDFYTNVHLPEVAERRGALRAVRYELLREVVPPHRGAPRYLALYEVDERGAAQRRHVGPPYQPGPEVWQRHTTPWRIWYRTLSPG